MCIKQINNKTKCQANTQLYYIIKYYRIEYIWNTLFKLHLYEHQIIHTKQSYTKYKVRTQQKVKPFMNNFMNIKNK